MEKIVSKRHPFKFYGSLAFIILLFLGISIGFIIVSYNDYTNSINKTQHLFFIAIGLIIFIIFFVADYIRNAPLIIISGKTIAFNGKTYNLDDIDRIEYTGKQSFKAVMRFPMEGAIIVFKDMSVKYIYDDMYKNTSELKMVLDCRINNKEFPVLKTFNQDISGHHFYYYKGNFFLSMRGLFFMGFVILFFYLITKLLTVYAYIPVIIVSLLCFGVLFLFSTHLNYFGLNKDYFIVKNYIFFWKTTVYHISDIKEIIYESQGKMPNCLRIITNDYKNKLYPAGTVRTSEWLEMKSIFEKENIIVRNECI